ncbi:MAG: amylo-alpha-1,6-glucosidase, partial [Candidatus Binataceae bacterium]
EAGGDILESPLEPMGFFHRDTRYLSRFEMRINGKPPHFFNSYLGDDKAQLRINMTNPDLGVHDNVIRLPRNSIQLERGWVLINAGLFHRVRVRNYAREAVRFTLDFSFAVDFADLFEVRGVKRKRHGRFSRPELKGREVLCRYRGLDRKNRFTRIVFDRTPDTLHSTSASFVLNLEPDEGAELEARIACGHDGERSIVHAGHPSNFDNTLAVRRAEILKLKNGWARITASNELFDSLLRNSEADLTSIITYMQGGAYMMAGVPWFATLFGRDSIITALSVQAFNPAVASGTLRILAGLQGTHVDESRDEQPGKIVHEVRSGEMAETGEIPFGQYYGSVDSTPLFLWLLGTYVETTGDLKLARELWPNVERALQWIERWGDRDGDGYIKYVRETPRGLANQGWKDSFDAISHADGSLAHAPIALAEVQGYAYAAYLAIADVAERLDHTDVASRMLERSAALKHSFERDFWFGKEKTVALALDSGNNPCRVVASNAGHCLATGLVDGERAAEAAKRLLEDDMFSGWGVRTLSANEQRYNPMSYHNGSVWPHDNAMAAAGIARAGNQAGVIRILNGLFDAATHLGEGSLPELFCGFPRETRLGPVPYPVACHPQAWSAASVFKILEAMLGLRIDGFGGHVIIDSPIMPGWLDWLKIEDLKAGSGSVSLLLKRTENAAAVEVLHKQGPISVKVIK